MSRNHKKRIHASWERFACGKIELFAKGWLFFVKKVKKVKDFDIMEKNRPQIFFSDERGYFDQKLAAESNKNSPEALQIRLLVGIGSFCCEKK